MYLDKRKIKTAYRPFFRTVRKIVMLFKKRPLIIDLNKEPLDKNAIYISNHSGASGPLTLSLYMPIFIVPWGAHEMVGNYRSRWRYLYYVFYQQKLGYKKFKSFIIATLFALISRMLYRGMQLIPTYQDVQLKSTIKHSVKVLNKGVSILIFPEDSTTGYHQELTSYNGGFVLLHEQYMRTHNIDLPIYPIYYSKDLNALIIGEKEYVTAKKEAGMKRQDIAEHFKDVTNELGKQLYAKMAKLQQ